MKSDKTTTTGEKAPTKGVASFISLLKAFVLTKLATLTNKVKTFLQPFVPKHRSVTVVIIILLATIIGKLLGVL